jgi:hypothetical protein
VSIPDLLSSITGYRVWTWDSTGLKSLSAKRWHPGQALAARCRASTVVGTIAGGTEAANDTHDAPEANCTCGIYATKTFDHFRGAGYERYGIHGEVNLWGKIVEHELGYRAQFAYPRNLVIPPDTLPHSSAPIRDRLRGLVAYGINIFLADDNGNIPLWTKHSGLNPAGLDYLIEIGKECCDRPQRHQILKKGDRLAVLGRGTAMVEHLDNERVRAVVLNKCELMIARSSIRWNGQYRRWETSPHACVETNAKAEPTHARIPLSG